MTYKAMSDTMEFLFRHRVKGLPPTALADVFDRMIWCLADQGAMLLRVREEWLISNNRERVEIALAMDETYPFTDIDRMEIVLSEITARWPDLRNRCAELLAARRAEGA